MKILKQMQRFSIGSLIAVHKHGSIYLLFTHDGIYAYGDEKEVERWERKINGK
jgi:hypothetical protein